MLNFQMNMPVYLMVFYGSIMIFAVLVLRGLLKNKLPKFVFPVLWSVILLRLLVPFSVSSPLSMKVPEFAADFPFREAYAESTYAISEDKQASEIPYEEVSLSTYYDESEAITEIPQASAFSVSYSDYFDYDRQILPIVIAGVYLTGLLVTAGVLATQKRRYSNRLTSSLLVEHNETINTLLREMNMAHILVFTNDEIASPLVCGLLSPRIYLPTRMDFGNTELLRHILCHETMHIRRKDNWVKSVMLLTLCLHWFNPLVWIMSKYLASDLEMACDEAVLRLYENNDESRKSYAFSLLAMAISGSRPTLLYSAFSKTEVEKRIQNVLHYHKASAFLLAVSICLVLGGSVAFATGGQAPFQPYLTSFCSSDSCRWGIRANLTRGVSLGENATERAEKLLFDIMRDDTTDDPDILKEQIINALSEEFHVEKGAFELNLSLSLDREKLFEEYEQWGLVRKEKENDVMLYNGETIRTYSDKMLGRYMSQPEGDVDITILRNRLGVITAVNVFHEGDTEYDRRTRDLEQSSWKYESHAISSEQGLNPGTAWTTDTTVQY